MWLLKPAEAKQRFEEVIAAVAQGEDVRIELDNGQRVKLVAEDTRPIQREPGTGKGLFIMAPDFDEPLQDTLLMTPVHKKRTPGSAEGKVWMSDDFDAPLPELEEYS